MSTPILVIIAVIILLLIWLVYMYNRLISLRNQTNEAWADIDVQLKRRYNLIPNLIETVKAYARHEQTVFNQVTEARAKAMQVVDVKAHAAAENALTQALKSIFAVAENYPDLKASQNFLQLQDELSDTENKIQAARRFFNSNVRDLNITIESFPSNIVAGIFNFQKKDFFAAPEEEKEVVQVKF